MVLPAQMAMVLPERRKRTLERGGANEAMYHNEILFRSADTDELTVLPTYNSVRPTPSLLRRKEEVE